MIGIGKIKNIFKDKQEEQKNASPAPVSVDLQEIKGMRHPLSESEKEKLAVSVMEKTGWDRDRVIRDMDEAEEEKGTDRRQYVAYRFYELSHKRRNDFYTSGDSAAFNGYHEAGEDILKKLADRRSFYKTYDRNIKRAWLPTEGLSLSDFRKAFSGIGKAVYKPVVQGLSKEIRVFDLGKTGLKDTFKEIMALPAGIVEEYIEQGKEMADLYPGSVNTLKIATLRTDKKELGIDRTSVHFIYAALTMGRDGACVDDIYNGGIIAGVDVKTGKVSTGGVDMNGESFSAHPDTDKEIKGFAVPYFEEAKKMAEESAALFKGFFEWSFAITSSGPVMVGVDVYPEAYTVQLPYAPVPKGRRKDMDKYFDVSRRPEMPYGTKISKISNKGIQYYWKKPEHAEGYAVFRSYEEDGAYEEIKRIANRAVGDYTDPEYDRDRHQVYYRVASYITGEDGNLIFSPKTDPKEAVKKTELEISLPELYLYSDSKRQLHVYYEWSELTDVDWSSDNEDIASVNSKGIVSGKKAGTCEITCFSKESGTAVKCKVTVDREAPEPLGEITSRYEYSEAEGCYVQKTPGTSGSAVIMMVGDMMCGKLQSNTQWTPEEGWNYNDSYEYVRKVTSEADLNVGNLETLLASGWPYMADEDYINNKNNCNSPSRYLDAVKYGGMDCVVMSNNHNCDGGTRALLQTIEQVDRYEFIRTGVFRDASEKRYFIVNVNGIKVGFLSYNSVKTGFNGKDADWSKEEKDIMLNIFDEEKIRKDVKDVREAGAEYVIVYMHWGAKNFKTPTKDQLTEAQQAADAGVDYIVGSNPHVLQRFDVLTSADGRKVPCAYSVGNFQSIMNQVEGNRDSVLLRIVLKRGVSGKVTLSENRYVPFFTYTNIEGCRWAPVPLTMNYDLGIKRVRRKEFRDRIVRSMGEKIKSIGN